MATRGAGVNIPVFSLRTKQSLGCGDFLDLIPFIDWAHEAGFRLIQILPVNDTSITETNKDRYPYSILSCFAFHPIYMNIHALGAEFGEEIQLIARELNLPKLDYFKTYLAKRELLRMLFLIRGPEDLATKAFAHFFEKNKKHLKPYAAFCVLRDQYGTSDFRKWGKDSFYSELLVEEICEKEAVEFYFFVQFHLDKQFREVHSYARKKGILLKGDFPMAVHANSVEAWRFNDYFCWDKSMGAPPDFYNAVGQNWGFPTYHWEEIRAENFYWLKARLAWMQQYFDYIRLDHVLGYFRIWEIPENEVRGLMGNFFPAKGYTDKEVEDPERLCNPYGKSLPKHLDTQKKVQQNISDPIERKKLYEHIENVCFFHRRGEYHPRIDCKSTHSFKELNSSLKKKVLELHDHYFLERQEELWEKEGREKLGLIHSDTTMRICAEDIGVIPFCVAKVLKDLKILNLHVQRMPKSFEIEFEHPRDFPSTCVCTPSNHDTATLREWWEENKEQTRRYYHTILGHFGDPPTKLSGELASEIIQAHLDSKAEWAIFLLQDLLAVSESMRHPDPPEERINDPAKEEGQWKWRMHLFVEELLLAKSFTSKLRNMVEKGKR